MEKLDVLLENYPQDLMEVINNLYKEKYPTKPKNPKSFCVIKVGDKIYDNQNFQDTYIEFLTDFNKFLSDETLSKSMGKYMTFSLSDVKNKAKEQGHFRLIDNRFYVNVKSSTRRKFKHISDIGDFLCLAFEFEFFEPMMDS